MLATFIVVMTPHMDDDDRIHPLLSTFLSIMAISSNFCDIQEYYLVILSMKKHEKFTEMTFEVQFGD